MKTESLKIPQIIQTYREVFGFHTLVAKKLGVTLQTLINYRKKYPQIDIVVKEITEGHLDMAEYKLLKLIEEGDLGAICFFLKCKGKERGYIERQEIIGKVDVQAISMGKVWQGLDTETRTKVLQAISKQREDERKLEGN